MGVGLEAVASGEAVETGMGMHLAASEIVDMEIVVLELVDMHHAALAPVVGEAMVTAEDTEAVATVATEAAVTVDSEDAVMVAMDAAASTVHTAETHATTATATLASALKFNRDSERTFANKTQTFVRG